MRLLEQRDFTDERSMIGVLYMAQSSDPRKNFRRHYALRVRKEDIDNSGHTKINLNNSNLPPTVAGELTSGEPLMSDSIIPGNPIGRKPMLDDPDTIFRKASRYYPPRFRRYDENDLMWMWEGDGVLVYCGKHQGFHPYVHTDN